MQKRAMRVITNSKWNVHTAPILKNLRVLILCNINKFQTGCFMFKVSKSLLSSNSIGTLLKIMKIDYHHTRNKLDFHVIHHSLTVHECSLAITMLNAAITCLHF